MRAEQGQQAFAEQVVIVTGGAAGIGRGIARCFAEEGARVVIADWNEADGEATREELGRGGSEAVFVKTDVSDPAQIERVAAAAMDRWGRIDVLVNNVGTHDYRPFMEMTAQDWDRLIASDLRGHFLMSRAVVPSMIARKSGSIVHIASVHALQTMPRFTVYAAAKGGIVSMTRGMALELAEHGIRVNAVLPGLTRNKNVDRSLQGLTDEERAERMKRAAVNVPLGRMADPKEIGNAVVFLAGAKASFITGACLTVDGGESAHLRW
jgi:NAD(P)-dependent dehydrogenase (short-subunit alcohol dehydrogenase family)